MFANEPMNWGPGDIRAHMVQQEATTFHEAGHAVVQYALGLGCSKISLFVTTKMEGEEEESAITESALKTKRLQTNSLAI